MRLLSYFAGVVLLATSTVAQVATYTNNGCALSVNIPSDTASSGSGSIYFQISAPSGISWVGFGQGSGMSGANMFLVYARDSTNVTLSPRLGTGHIMPEHDTSAQVTLLEGSGISSDGSMVANIRCDNCNTWSGGSMSFTDSSSNWIFASRSGSALKSSDVSATISQHSVDDTFSLDLTSGTGGSSTNPFVQSQGSSSSSGSTATSASASQTGTRTTATSTNGVSNPLASSGSSSSSSSGSSSQSSSGVSVSTLTTSHGLIMSILFVGCFPLFSLTLYLPFAQKVRFVHAPLQILSTILLIVGLALGVILGNRIGQLDGYHMVIGFIIVAGLVLFQPAMGIYQHLHYHRTGGRSAFGVAHRWVGRALIALGIVNGGIGWMITGTTSAYTPYAVVAAIVFVIYVAVLVFAWYRSSQIQNNDDEKSQPSDRSYEMQPNRGPKHTRLGSNPVDTNQSMYQQQQRSGGYSTGSRQ